MEDCLVDVGCEVIIGTEVTGGLVIMEETEVEVDDAVELFVGSVKMYMDNQALKVEAIALSL